MENLENQHVEPPPQEPKFFEKYGIAMAILGGLMFIAVSIYLSFGLPNSRIAGQSQQSQTAIPDADDDPFLGRSDAPVTIIEFSDFQCPFCRKLWKDILPQLKADYIDTGKVKFVYRDFPLSNKHEMAQISAEAAECAEDQGKYWEMHDKMFAEQDRRGQNTVRYTASDLKQWAGEIGIEQAEFGECLGSGKYTAEVENDLADGISAEIDGTPATFINGKFVSGVKPYSQFKALIEQALAKL